MTAALTDEELAQIRARWTPTWCGKGHAEGDVRALLAEVERLRAAERKRGTWERSPEFTAFLTDLEKRRPNDEDLKVLLDALDASEAEAREARVRGARATIAELEQRGALLEGLLTLLRDDLEAARAFNECKGGQQTNGLPPVLRTCLPSVRTYLERIVRDAELAKGGG